MNIEIDEKRKYVLTKVIRNKNGLKVQESDHNPIIIEFKLEIKEAAEANKLELYNLKNEECQAKFMKYTNETNMLSTVFNADEDINVLTNRFMKKLDGCIAVNFKKIRISKNKRDKEVDFHSKLQELKDKEDDASKRERTKVLDDIAAEAYENFTSLKTEVDRIKKKLSGMNGKQIWKLKNKLCPRNKDPPTAMLDDKGNLLTGSKAIEKKGS